MSWNFQLDNAPTSSVITRSARALTCVTSVASVCGHLQVHVQVHVQVQVQVHVQVCVHVTEQVHTQMQTNYPVPQFYALYGEGPTLPLEGVAGADNVTVPFRPH